MRFPWVHWLACLVLLTLMASTAADVDLWGHVHFGQQIVERASVERADTYSFTSDRPWVNHEWLAEVLMWRAYDLGGGAGLVLLKLLCIGLALVPPLARLQAHGASIRFLFATALVLGVVTFPRTQYVRPQLFSVVLFSVLVMILGNASDGRRKPLVALPLIFAAWTNLHGGWLVGLGTLGVWAALEGIRSVRDRRWLTTANLGILFLACAGASLINPYGLGLWLFLKETVGLNRPDITEWWPMYRMPAAVIGLWCISAGLLVLAVASRRYARPAAALVAPCLMLALASLRVNRIDAFFALAVLTLLGPRLQTLLDSSARRRDAVSPASPVRRRLAAAVVCAVSFAIAAGVTAKRAACVSLDRPWVADLDAADAIAANRLEGKLVTAFAWGEFAIWHFHPSLHVSMDGRRETVYSDQLIQDHISFYSSAPAAVDYPERLGADYVWLPQFLPVVDMLRHRGWFTAYETSRSVVLSRHDRPLDVAVAKLGPACFPGSSQHPVTAALWTPIP